MSKPKPAKPRITTMVLSLPPPLLDQLTKKIIRLGSYVSVSDYVRDLIRCDLKRDAIAHVDELLLEGLASGPSEPVNAAWREARRAELARHRRERAKKQRERT